MEEKEQNDKEIKSPIQMEDIVEAQIKEAIPDAYIIRERMGGCKICGREQDLRFGWCFPCAEAQNIIGRGEDMYADEKADAIELPTKEVNSRLKMLLGKGWKYLPDEVITRERILMQLDKYHKKQGVIFTSEKDSTDYFKGLTDLIIGLLNY